jgi:hypothetical protein
MVIPPRPYHAFGVPVVWHDIVVVGKQFMADGALPVLLNNLPIQQFPHLPPGTAVPGTPLGDADPRCAARPSLLFWASFPLVLLRGHSKATIAGRDNIHCDAAS